MCAVASSVAGLSFGRGEDAIGWDAFAFAEVRSAYISRGRVVNDSVFSPLFGRVRVKFPHGFYLGGSWWSVSAYDGCGQSAARRFAFHENDANAFVGWRLDLSEEWQLDSHFHHQWVLLEGYRSHPSTTLEWQFGQSLENPYVVPYYLMRHARHPRPWTYWETGLRHVFDLGRGFYLSPSGFVTFSDAQHADSQYGHADYPHAVRAGISAVNVLCRIGWCMTDWLRFYVQVHQFDVVAADARAAIGRNSAKQARKDLTVFSVGAAVSF